MSKKADLRKIKKKQKQEHNKDKNVRLQQNIEINSKLLISDFAPDLKEFGTMPPIEKYQLYKFEWSDKYKDIEGNWSWGESRSWSSKEYTTIVSKHLNSMNQNSWNQIERMTYSGKQKKRCLVNKYQEIDTLCAEAQTRWLSNDILCQFTELFRLRKGTYKRIWGVRCNSHFFLVWYERKHNIYPIDD